MNSNTQACEWTTKCAAPTDLTAYTCDKANKYGCLHMTDKQCGWSDKKNACFEF